MAVGNSNSKETEFRPSGFEVAGEKITPDPADRP